MRPEDNSVLCFLVLTILNELKVSKSVDTTLHKHARVLCCIYKIFFDDFTRAPLLCPKVTTVTVSNILLINYKLLLIVPLFLQALLFNLNKPFTLGSGSITSSEDLMVDCFVSSFRNNYRNIQHFEPCLLTTSPVIFNLVSVKSIYIIVTEVSIPS